jgi:hypothetical protein
LLSLPANTGLFFSGFVCLSSRTKIILGVKSSSFTDFCQTLRVIQRQYFITKFLIYVCLFLDADLQEHVKVHDTGAEFVGSSVPSHVQMSVDTAEVKMPAGAESKPKDKMDGYTPIFQDNSKHRCLDDVGPSFNIWIKVVIYTIVWTY